MQPDHEQSSENNNAANNPYAATSQNLDIPNTGERQLAERGTRLAAVLLDSVLFFVVGIAAAVIIPMSALGGNLSSGIVIFCAVLGIAAVAWVIAQLVFIARYAQTIGKRIMNVRVVRTSTGEQCGLGRYFWLRMVVTGMFGAIPIIGGIINLVGILLIFRDDRRCLHDLIADTVVVKV